MCEPVSMAAAIGMSSQALFAAQLAVTGLTAVTSYVGQQQAADAQVKATEANALAVRNAAVSSMVTQGEDLQQRELQEGAATALKTQSASLKARNAKSTASATSESAGLSVQALLGDYDRQYSSYADAQAQQLGFTTDQLQRQREGIEAQAAGRVNTVPLMPVQGPSLGGAILGFGGSALSSFSDFAVRDPITGNLTIT